MVALRAHRDLLLHVVVALVGCLSILASGCAQPTVRTAPFHDRPDSLDPGDLRGPFDGRVVEFLLEFFIDSFQNTIQAFIWPVNIVRLAPPYGAIALGVVTPRSWRR